MTELEREIRAAITAGGPMPFSRFMSLALYHPRLGYYRRPHDPFGMAGDFYTNAQLQPVFGRLIAQKIAAWRKLLGKPADFTVVELGAGRGETGREIRGCLPDVHYVEIEARAGKLPGRITGVIFSNEFFDALPVQVIRWRGASPGSGRALQERFVGVEQDQLAWVEAEPSSPALDEYVRRFSPSPAAGQVVEASFEALQWLERIARSLERGFVLTIDYGYTAPEIAAGRRFPEGSLMSYFRHTAQEDVLREPGERDITAHVNFTALVEHGRALGLRELPLESQAQFLLSIGQADEFQSALAAATESEAQRHRMLLKTLLYGMGDTFRVLVQEKP